MSANTKSASLIKDSSGMTIVELIIVITLMAILSITFMAVFTGFLVTMTRQNLEIEMTNDSQNLLRTMVEELRYGAGVRQTNTIIDPNESSGWSTSDTNFVIITAVPALDSNNEYILNTETGSPFMNEFVYYRQGNVLYKRTLAADTDGDPGADENKSRTSCFSPGSSGSCPSSWPADRKLVEGISSMTFALYDQDDDAIPIINAALARSIEIDLTLSRNTFGNPVTFDNSIRITLRNVF